MLMMTTTMTVISL